MRSGLCKGLMLYRVDRPDTVGDFQFREFSKQTYIQDGAYKNLKFKAA